MQIMEQICPIGQVQWETVKNDYNVFFPERMCNLDNLQRQFNCQVKKKAPTDDPNIPAYVLLAKRIQAEIIKKADAMKLGEDKTDDELADAAVGKPVKPTGKDDSKLAATCHSKASAMDNTLQAFLMG